MRSACLLAFLLSGLCWAQPIRQVQGGLVDVRYGQVSVDRGGNATVLDLMASSKLFLDGRLLTAEELLKEIPRGLSAVATYHESSGAIEKLEAFSAGSEQPRAALRLLPRKAPAYRRGDLLTVLVAPDEAARMGEGATILLTPGLSHTLFVPAQGGGLKAMARLNSSSNLVEVPVLVERGGKVYRGPSLSVAATGPEVLGFGPEKASSELATIPGWVDISHPPRLLDLSSARLRVSPGLRVVQFQPRIDRSVFELEADGPGQYWLEFEVADVLGEACRKRWILEVRP